MAHGVLIAEVSYDTGCLETENEDGEDEAAKALSECDANARLIAAAPDLLDALKELAEIVDGLRGGEGTLDSFTLQPARAAIAKATGSVP